jgi:hypothetical protein
MRGPACGRRLENAMADNDDLDQWLGEQITPLPPPEGTFRLIKRRARRRKARKLAVTLTAAAAVVAAAILIPRVTLLQVGPAGKDVAAGRSNSPVISPSAQQDGTGTHAPTPSASPSIAAKPPVPGNFQPTSVTFIGTLTGWVIGQAGTPGDCATQYCTSIARTDDGGTSWYGVPAPETGAPSGSSGVSQIRFLNSLDGWAYGPQLWATTDGGQTWTQVNIGDQRVVDLETVGSRAFAVLATCTGSGSDYLLGCASFTMETALAGSDTWTPVLTSLNDAGKSPGAALVLTGAIGYLVLPSGRLYSGPVSSASAWTALPVVSACSSFTSSLPLLAAGTSTDLALVCGSSVLRSSSGGTSWTASGSAPSGTPASLAETSTGTLVIAGSTGISYELAGATSWSAASVHGGDPYGGFSYVGMTTPSQGVAVPVDASLHEIWMTTDGGQNWYPVPITGS